MSGLISMLLLPPACRWQSPLDLISEANSGWNGGQEGVFDSFSSALWCADMMLHFASLAVAGINLHGLGNGWYSPMVGSPSSGSEKRPEFFGIQLAQQKTLSLTAPSLDGEVGMKFVPLDIHLSPQNLVRMEPHSARLLNTGDRSGESGG